MSYYAVKPNFKPGVTCGPLTGFQLPVRMTSFLGSSELFLRLSRKRKFRSIIGKISVYFNFLNFICIALQDLCTILFLIWIRRVYPWIHGVVWVYIHTYVMSSVVSSLISGKKKHSHKCFLLFFSHGHLIVLYETCNWSLQICTHCSSPPYLGVPTFVSSCSVR
jgi:hypothetical protein